MTMSNNSGSTVYKKLSIADATGYYVSCVDETLRSQQRELLGIDDPVTESAESENTGENADTSETSESDNTEGNADVSDTEAAESVS